MFCSSGRGPQRQYQDSSYFKGVLRSKITELTSEISRMRTEIGAATEEQSTFLTYDKVDHINLQLYSYIHDGLLQRVKETAAELTELQATLADYNLLVDKLNTDTEVLLVRQEAQEMASQNEADSRDVDSIFAEKQARETQIQRLEQEVWIMV